MVLVTLDARTREASRRPGLCDHAPRVVWRIGVTNLRYGAILTTNDATLLAK